MSTDPSLLAAAFDHFQAGRLPAVEEICRRILKNEPASVDAEHLLGLIAYKAGNLRLGIRGWWLEFRNANFDFRDPGTGCPDQKE